MSWLPEELLQSDWIQTVALPRLESADQPVASDIDAFVERLRQAIVRQIQTQPSKPDCLEGFLKEASWTGVFQKISAQYQGRSDA